MSIILALSFAGLLLAALLGLARILRSGSLADRVLGMDFFVLVIAAGIILGAVRRGNDFFVPIVVVVALLAFVATTTVARYIERRGA